VDPRLIAGSIVASLAVVAVVAAWAWRRHRERRSLDRRLRELSRAVLNDFVLPDGNGGEILIHYALLTAAGIVVLDIKDVDGNVFGSEGMQDWTVIARDRRYTFVNPQPGLWDRVAAIKRLVPEDMPVSGVIAFTGRARFAKGRPLGVVMLEEWLMELATARDQSAESAADQLASWDRLREAAQLAGLSQLREVR
jgi:hypothetical protein